MGAKPEGQSTLFGEAPEAQEGQKQIRGYPFGVVASALQKEIRRGDERRAVYWALLLLEAAPYYAWKRVLVTAAEDVGLAAPEVVAEVVNLAVAWRLCKEKSRYVSAHHVTMAVMLLCRAPKSTEVEDLQTLTLEAIKGGERFGVLPEYEDAHTQVGREQGKTWKDWYGDRHGTLGVPVNPYTRELWARRPEWDPRTGQGDGRGSP